MKKISIIKILCVLIMVPVFLFISCKETYDSTIVDPEPDQVKTYSFFPLNVGNKWRYHLVHYTRSGYPDQAIIGGTRGLIEFEIIDRTISSQYNLYKCINTYYDSLSHNSTKIYYTLMEMSDSAKVTFDSSSNTNQRYFTIFGSLKSFKIKAIPSDTTLFINPNLREYYTFKNNVGLTNYTYQDWGHSYAWNITTTLLDYYLR